MSAPTSTLQWLDDEIACGICGSVLLRRVENPPRRGSLGSFAPTGAGHEEGCDFARRLAEALIRSDWFRKRMADNPKP